MRRIVVTGMGAVTPLAANVEVSWSRLLAGRSGIRRLPDDVVGDLPAKIGGVVPSLEEDPDAGFDPDVILSAKDQRKVDRFILFALASADFDLIGHELNFFDAELLCRNTCEAKNRENEKDHFASHEIIAESFFSILCCQPSGVAG